MTIVRMEEIAAREARDRWAELLQRVRWRDESFVITQHGTPVAQLGPIKEGCTSSDDE